MKAIDYFNVFNVSRVITILLLLAIFLNPFFLEIFLESQYLIVVIIFALLVTSVTFGYDLVTKKIYGVSELVRKYFFLSLSIIMLFGIIYFIVFNYDRTTLKAPYPIDALSDPFYFSATTFYTVGYGDIVPRHGAKVVSVVQMILGSMVNLVVLALAIKRLRY